MFRGRSVLMTLVMGILLSFGGCSSSGSSDSDGDKAVADGAAAAGESKDSAVEEENDYPKSDKLLVTQSTDLAGYKLTSVVADHFGGKDVISVEFDCDGGFRQEWEQVFEGLEPSVKWIEGNEIFIETVGYLGEDVLVIRWSGLDKFGQSGNDGRIYFRNEANELTVAESCFNSYTVEDDGTSFFLKTIEQTKTCN
jgi:hypothetical protein